MKTKKAPVKTKAIKKVSSKKEKNPVPEYLSEIAQKMKIQFEEDEILAKAKAIKEKRGLKKRLIEGVLTTYYETGMEGMIGLVLQDRTQITPNKNYDPNDPSKGPSHWYSHEGLFFLENGDYLKVFGEDDKVIFEGELVKDRKAMAEGGYRVSLMVVGIDKETWYSFFKKELKAHLFCERIPYDFKRS